MTNKTLSEQICEICGIEPIYKVMLDNTLMNITDDRNEAEVSAFESGGVIIDTYPDFEQPENFVILFELINKQTRSEFLQRLVQRLRVEAGWYTDEIKQSIRETEWVY